MPKWLEHAALSVSDLDRSIAFYRDHLGLRLARVIEPDGGSRLGDIVGLPGCLARIAHLESEKGMLELFEYRRPRGRLRRRNRPTWASATWVSPPPTSRPIITGCARRA